MSELNLLDAQSPKKRSSNTSDEVGKLVGAGKRGELKAVDFDDPARKLTCLETDFPIVPINRLAALEGNSGKPIYQMSKWWARRRPSVFRATLLGAAAEAPRDTTKSAKLVWDSYYSNHQLSGAFSGLKVADIFMGGGTTIVEASRLGMEAFGNDLNPVAWFVVKSELSDVDPEEVRALLGDIESEVKPQLMPFFTCDGPDNERGQWRNVETGALMPESFDAFNVQPEERKRYRYEGPEIIYTFWTKHGPCQTTGCGHRTPLLTTPVVAIKTLTVQAWIGVKCGKCNAAFDIERYACRMAPDVPLANAPSEPPYTVMSSNGRYECPSCQEVFSDPSAAANGSSSQLGKASNKKVQLTLLVHPSWLRGQKDVDAEGRALGGSVTDTVDSTTRWLTARAGALRLLEVRGPLPEEVTCPATNVTFRTDEQGGNVPQRSTFVCQAPTCGTRQDVLDAVKASGKTGPMAPYAIQGYSLKRDTPGRPYGGRFFAPATDTRRYTAAASEWERRKDSDLAGYWPQSELPYGFMTHHLNGGIPNHGFTHWWKMFNPLQLLTHALILKAIVNNARASWAAKEAVLGAFQQYLRNQNMFCFWDREYDKLVPHMSNNNFHPKANVVENSVFASLGRGNWVSCSEGILEGLEWARNPWEPVSSEALSSAGAAVAKQVKGKSVKVQTNDPVQTARATLSCGSSTELPHIQTSSIDLCITDPPFGGLLHYSELSDFFYVWLRLALRERYPENFTAEYVPKALEAVSNKAMQPEEPDAFYQRVLTNCWREAHRILKPGGILAFTFHHSEDEPWVHVLESLFDAGFYLEATFPIRGDETKGEGEFGSRQIEFDILHVCRKRVSDPPTISWARLRRLLTDEVRSLTATIGQHQSAGLPEADLRVIKRGKALEYFSKHYGRVYVEQGRSFTVREALVGINQVLEDEADTTLEAPPPQAEPYTRQFFRIFYERASVPRDQMQKFLRGTGIAPSEFEERGWCKESKRVFTLTPFVELATKWKGLPRKGMARDFDQTVFLVGACFDGSNIRVVDTLNSPGFTPHPATAGLVDWLTRHAADRTMRQAAARAKQIFAEWLSKNQAKADEQLRLFDLTGGTSESTPS